MPVLNIYEHHYQHVFRHDNEYYQQEYQKLIYPISLGVAYIHKETLHYAPTQHLHRRRTQHRRRGLICWPSPTK